jgi:hypothetical protein
MELITIDMCYAVRVGFELPLPEIVKNSFKVLRITPPIYKPIKRINRNNNFRNFRKSNSASISKNWREEAIKQLVIKKVKDPNDDKEYHEVIGLLNKISMGNVIHLSIEIINCIEKRDDEFRLRVSKLLFDKAITQPLFSEVMAECAKLINEEISEMAEDLQAHVSMFSSLYNMTETVAYPKSSDENFDEKIIEWSKQKEKRRGYAKFMMELFARNLINEEPVKQSLEQIVSELNETSRQPKTRQTEENVSQFVSFLFETCKNVKGELNEYLKTTITEFLKIPKTEVPSLNMRSKFTLEDALKELNIKQ